MTSDNSVKPEGVSKSDDVAYGSVLDNPKSWQPSSTSRPAAVAAGRTLDEAEREVLQEREEATTVTLTELTASSGARPEISKASEFVPKLFEPLAFSRGPAMKNRFMVAPMTNLQSHPDGTLSNEEYRWLTMRAQGNFGLTMTCAASIEATAQGFPGNLGIYSDMHIEGLTRLASGIKQANSVAIAQLYHSGTRVISGPLLSPSADAETGAPEMTSAQIKDTIEWFIAAAERADKAGFDGVELHGAHGYLISAFLSPELNRRTDEYGGTLEKRARLLREIISGIRQRCNPQFMLGVRLSAERFGIDLNEMRELAEQLMLEGNIDFLDMSLWDVFKEPVDEKFHGRTLMSCFTDLKRGKTRLGFAGSIYSAHDAAACIEAGADFVLIGRSAILHHNFPDNVREDHNFRPLALPVPRAHLEAEGLSPVFLDYLSAWPGFVQS